MDDGGRSEHVAGPDRLATTSRRRRAALLLVPVLVVLLAALFGLRKIDNNDTWWHLATGRWIVEHRSVPDTDVLSFTVPDHPWVNVQWLFDVTIYTIARIGGTGWLVVFSALCHSLTIALLLRNLIPRVGPIAAAPFALAGLIVAEERFSVRPEMISFLLLQVVLWIHLTARGDRRRRLWLLPAVMALWVNCHSLFVLGLIVTASYLGVPVLVRLVRRDSGRRTDRVAVRTLVIVGALSLLATLANPFGVTGALFPLDLLSRIDRSIPAFASIAELDSPFSNTGITTAVRLYRVYFVFAVAVVAGASALAMLSRPGRRRFDLAGLLVFVAFAYLSVQARRNMAVFVLTTAPFVAACSATLAARAPLPTRRMATRLAPLFAIAVAIGLGLGGALVGRGDYYRSNQKTREFGVGMLSHYFPTDAITFIRATGIPRPMFNDFTSGGYLAWDPPLGQGVFIDGRTEVYETAFFSRYVESLREPPRWQQLADEWGIQSVLLFHRFGAHRSLVRWLLRDERWSIVYVDEVALVALRRRGNADVIRRAQAIFAARRGEIERSLLAPHARRPWPAGLVGGLVSYATVLGLTGHPTETVRFYTRALELDPAPGQEVAIRLFLAQLASATGDAEAVSIHLDRAEALRPGDPDVNALRRRLGSN